jgi:hypothetical protein
MAQTTANLPNGGKTAHYAVSYDDGLPNTKGHDLAVDLMNFLEDDLALIISWFVGVNFQFSFLINVQITGNSGGASWTDPPDIPVALGYSPTVVLSPGGSPTADNCCKGLHSGRDLSKSYRQIGRVAIIQQAGSGPLSPAIRPLFSATG